MKITYAEIAKGIDYLKQLEKIRKFASFGEGNYKKLIKFIDDMSKEYPLFLTEERLGVFRSQIEEGLKNTYSRDLATIKCKQFLYEIGLSLIAHIRGEIADFNVSFIIAFNKQQEIGALLTQINNQLLEMNKTKTIFNKDYDTKNVLLESNRENLCALYNGEFFLNNSVISLLKTLSRTCKSLFLPEDTDIGSNYVHQFGITHTCQKLKFYVDRNEVGKYLNDDGEKLVNYHLPEVKEAVSKLKKFTTGTDAEIIHYIKKANSKDLTNQPDDPNGTAMAWVETINALIDASDRSFTNWNNLKNRVNDLSTAKLTPIEEMCKNLEEVYKEREKEENITELDKNVTDYLEVISIGVVTYNFYLEFNSYDITSFLTDLNFLSFYVNLLHSLVGSYNDRMMEIVKQKMANAASNLPVNNQPSVPQGPDLGNTGNPPVNNNQPAGTNEPVPNAPQDANNQQVQVQLPTNQQA